MDRAAPRQRQMRNINNYAAPMMAQQSYQSNSNYQQFEALDYGEDMNYDGIIAPQEARFEKSGQTNEYIERQYYKGDSITFNNTSLKFWLDLYNHILENPSVEGFLSKNFIFATTNLTELIAAIAFLDLLRSIARHFLARGCCLFPLSPLRS